MSEQFLATASVRIVPDLTGFAAALQAEVGLATKAVKIPTASTAAAAGAAAGLTAAQKAQTVATNRLVGATEILNVTKKQQATLDRVAADAAKIEADALHAQAVAAADAARAHGQLARGVTTATASQFGLRGAVLASSGPFLAGVIAVELARKSIDAFSQEQESAARVTAILGDELGKSSEEWAKQQAAIGLSAEAALKYQGAIAQVFANVRIASAENAKFSQELVTRAADVAARSNVPVTQVLRAFQLALSGNLRGLRQFVPAVSAATIVQQAFADTGKTVKANLTEQELVLARYEVLLATSANQAGAFGERQKGAAAQSKILASNLSNLGAALGAGILPGLTKTTAELVRFVHGIQVGVTWLHNATAASRDFSTSVETNLGFHDVTSSLDRADIAARLQEIASEEGIVGVATEQLSSNFSGLIDPINQAALAFRNLRNEIVSASGDIIAADNKLLAQQIQGASSAERIATLQAKAGAAQTILGALGGPRGQRGRQALQTKAAAIAEIKSIRDADAAAAKAAAAEAEAAAKRAAAEAEAARRAHDAQVEVDIADLQFRSDRKHLRAQRTKSLVDDLAADRADLKIIDQQIDEARKILDATTRKQKIQSLTLAREQAAQQLTADKQAQIQRQKEHRDLIRSRTEQRLQLDIEIATTNKNISAEKRALEARIAYDRAQLNNVHGDLVRKKQLQLEIAQDTQALKDLKKANDDRKNEFAALEFSFLQTQAGFASSLLSNLLPSASVAGTVGGTAGAISTSTGPGPAGFATAVHRRPGRDLSAASQIAGGPSGPSSGQLSTLIHVQRLMLNAILHLVGQRTHPEAVHQRVTESVGLDTIR